MEITFAPALPEDVQTIWEWNRDLIARYEDPDAVDMDRVLKWTLRKIQGNLDQYHRILADGEHVGFFRLDTRESCRELDDFFLFPRFRGGGIGTRVLEWCLKEAKGPLELCVFKGNEGALRLYRRMGFEIVEHISHTRCMMRREGL